MKCRVLHCDSDNDGKASSCSFFHFPTDHEVARKWVLFCRQDTEFNWKTSVVCMKHFNDEDFANFVQFNMGFAKNRLLKRGAVPTIYGDEPANEPVENEGNRSEVSSIDASTTATESELYYDANIVEVDALKTKLATLQRENKLLKVQNRKQRIDFAGLKRRSDMQRKKNVFEIKSLQKPLEIMTDNLRNMEIKLSSIFTIGQIKKIKSGSIRRNWTRTDIAQAITLYAASTKAYRLLYKQRFPLPGVRTLQKWAQKLDVSRERIGTVFRLLAASTHMDEQQKRCVLNFEEVQVPWNPN